MLVYRCLLTIMLTWQSSCVIAYYNGKNIQNLYVQACNLVIYFKVDNKKHTHENIVPVIDRGVFHNYVHACKQLVL